MPEHFQYNLNLNFQLNGNILFWLLANYLSKSVYVVNFSLATLHSKLNWTTLPDTLSKMTSETKSSPLHVNQYYDGLHEG